MMIRSLKSIGKNPSVDLPILLENQGNLTINKHDESYFDTKAINPIITESEGNVDEAKPRKI